MFVLLYCGDCNLLGGGECLCAWFMSRICRMRASVCVELHTFAGILVCVEGRESGGRGGGVVPIQLALNE